MLLLTFGSLLTFLRRGGTAQEAVRDAARVSVTSRDGPGVVDACGIGVGRARRVEGGELAVARAQEAMIRIAVRVKSRDRTRSINAVRTGRNRARRIKGGEGRLLRTRTQAQLQRAPACCNRL